MTDYAVCLDCGEVIEDTPTGLHSGKHLKATGHRATVGTQTRDIADRWSARYRAAQEGGSLHTPRREP